MLRTGKPADRNNLSICFVKTSGQWVVSSSTSYSEFTNITSLYKSEIAMAQKDHLYLLTIKRYTITYMS